MTSAKLGDISLPFDSLSKAATRDWLSAGLSDAVRGRGLAGFTGLPANLELTDALVAIFDTMHTGAERTTFTRAVEDLFASISIDDPYIVEWVNFVLPVAAKVQAIGVVPRLRQILFSDIFYRAGRKDSEVVAYNAIAYLGLVAAHPEVSNLLDDYFFSRRCTPTLAYLVTDLRSRASPAKWPSHFRELLERLHEAEVAPNLGPLVRRIVNQIGLKLIVEKLLEFAVIARSEADIASFVRVLFMENNSPLRVARQIASMITPEEQLDVETVAAEEQPRFETVPQFIVRLRTKTGENPQPGLSVSFDHTYMPEYDSAHVAARMVELRRNLSLAADQDQLFDNISQLSAGFVELHDSSRLIQAARIFETEARAQEEHLLLQVNE